MSEGSSRIETIDNRVEEICAKAFTGISPEERAEMRSLLDERIKLMTVDISSLPTSPP